MFVLISFPQTIYEQQNSALVRGTKNLALLEPQYGSFISRIFQSISRIFPFYGIGQNYGNWNFQHFLMQYFQNILILWERSIFSIFSSSLGSHTVHLTIGPFNNCSRVRLNGLVQQKAVISVRIVRQNVRIVHLEEW